MGGKERRDRKYKMSEHCNEKRERVWLGRRILKRGAYSSRLHADQHRPMAVFTLVHKARIVRKLVFAKVSTNRGPPHTPLTLGASLVTNDAGESKGIAVHRSTRSTAFSPVNDSDIEPLSDEDTEGSQAKPGTVILSLVDDVVSASDTSLSVPEAGRPTRRIRVDDA